MAKRLLRRYPDMLENVDPSNGWSSLHYAAYNGRYLVCVHLISLGHDKSETLRTFKRNTSVHLSLMNGHEQTTHLLLQHFPTLISEGGENGQTPLHVSCVHDYFKCVDMLLGMNVNINAVDEEGNNALHTAMKYGALKSIRLLIQHNIDTTHKNKNGLTPLDVAASFQVEKHYRSILSDSASNTDAEDSASLNIGSTSLRESTSLQTEPLAPIQPTRTHSNSLPPLPTVTTARRASTASSTTKSPVPRSAISLGFTGSNSNSYIYSPAQSNGSGLNSTMNLSIKPPSMGISSSPVLYSPTGNGLIPSIREEQPQSSHLLNSHSLTSFPSMSSLSSGKNTPTEGRTRASSQAASVGISFTPLHKSRSNSHGSRTHAQASTPQSLTQSINTTLPKPSSNPPGRISPAESSLSLSRSPTGSDGGESIKVQSTGGSAANSSGLMSSFAEGSENLRMKYSEKLENATSDYGKRKAKGSILNIPIASMGRTRRE